MPPSSAEKKRTAQVSSCIPRAGHSMGSTNSGGEVESGVLYLCERASMFALSLDCQEEESGHWVQPLKFWFFFFKYISHCKEQREFCHSEYFCIL